MRAVARCSRNVRRNDSRRKSPRENRRSPRPAGWAIQNYKQLNLGTARGIALREVPLDSGRCDYLLLVDRIPLGVIEAKKEGTTLSTVSDQSSHYGENLPDFLAALPPGTKKIPFA